MDFELLLFPLRFVEEVFVNCCCCCCGADKHGFYVLFLFLFGKTGEMFAKVVFDAELNSFRACKYL